MGFYEPSWDQDGNPEVGTWVKEEPDCHTCSDRRTVHVDALGHIRPGWDDEHGPLTETNCPECNPTEEQNAAQVVEAQRRQAEYERAVAAGEIDPDEDPWS